MNFKMWLETIMPTMPVVPLDFDKLYGKAFKVTYNSGDRNLEGFSIVTPENNDSWYWEEAPQYKEIVKANLNKNGWLNGYKYDQIYRSAVKLGLL
jgi:hypothetical protein